MQQDSVSLTRLMQVFRHKLEVEVPSPETDLVVTGLMDSLVFVELLFQLESEFGVRIAVDQLDLDQFRSVVSILRFIEQLEQAA